MKNNYLEKLLDGEKVEWKALGDLTIIKTGQSVSKNIISDNQGIYPVINSGREPLGFINIWNTENDPIGVTTRGAGVGSVTWQEGRYFRGNLNYSVTINCDILNIRYLYHTLLVKQKDIHQLCTFDGIPALNASNLKILQIPIPSLAVQEKIVSILDEFTDYLAELKKELSLRKKQYQYYREKLFTFDEEVEWKELGEIGAVKMCKRILKQQTSPNGEIPFYKIGTFGKEPDSFISKELFDEYKDKFSYPKNGEILISASGTIGRTVIFDGKEAYFQDSNIVWIANDEKIVLNKFLFYFYKIVKWDIAEGGTIARLYNDNLRKTLIPIPSLEKQAEIVKILDQFDTLVNSLSEGLPREIELRQKQYEYYREQLFAFPKE